MGIIKAIISVLVPGAGALFRRKYFSGAAMVIMWLLLIETLIGLAVVRPVGIADYVMPAGIAGAIAVFALNLLTQGVQLSQAGRKAKADQMFSQALSSFVAGDDEKAEEILHDLQSIDRLDVDCLFLRAKIALKQGKTRRAGRLFRKCRDFDEKGKWSWEIRQATNRL